MSPICDFYFRTLKMTNQSRQMLTSSSAPALQTSSPSRPYAALVQAPAQRAPNEDREGLRPFLRLPLTFAGSEAPSQKIVAGIF